MRDEAALAALLVPASAPEPESVAGPTFITDEEPTAADVARALCTIEERKHDAAAVVTMMRANEGCAPVQRAGAICGRTAATREEGRAGEAAVARSGAPATAGRPCTASHACTAVCAASAGIWALFALSSGEQAARASVVDAGGAEVVAVLMLVYPAALGMQEKGCRVRWRRASMGDQGDFLLSAFSSANSCRVSENHSTALVAPRFILPSTSLAQKSLGLPPLQLWVPPITPLSLLACLVYVCRRSRQAVANLATDAEQGLGACFTPSELSCSLTPC